MTTDLKMLLAVSVLSLFQFMPYFMAYIKRWGISGIIGNREDMPALPGWANRALEAQKNLNENLVHFAAIVLIVHAVGASNEMSALGATIFLYSRLIYWGVFIAGIKWVRTMAFMAGFMGELLILAQLF
ncbi:MAG: MAPEG family protein [Gammaproteobacteria bacterium]